MSEHPVIWYALWFVIGGVVSELIRHHRKMAREKNEKKESNDE